LDLPRKAASVTDHMAAVEVVESRRRTAADVAGVVALERHTLAEREVESAVLPPVAVGDRAVGVVVIALVITGDPGVHHFGRTAATACTGASVPPAAPTCSARRKRGRIWCSCAPAPSTIPSSPPRRPPSGPRWRRAGPVSAGPSPGSTANHRPSADIARPGPA